MTQQNPNSQQRPRYQQQYQPYQNARSQYDRSQESPKQALEREMRDLGRTLSDLDVLIDAQKDKWNELQAAKQRHQQQIPLAVGQVVLSAFGVRLPPVARTWHYEQHRYTQSENVLRQHAINLATRRAQLVARMEQVQVDLDQLQFHP